MRKLSAFIRHLKAVIAFNQMPVGARKLTIYSEGRNYWSYLGGLLQQILETSDVDVCYVCSSDNDPGLELDHPRLKQFIIGEGFVRDWFFANVDTKLMIMTMPDLDQYQVKRSSHDVHYVYVQHSLVSLHMVYRQGAFDAFDTIFIAGPHHIAEMRAIETQRNLTAKRLFEHGYARLDAIQAEATDRQDAPLQGDHYLLAPSWGPNGTIETGVGKKIVDFLMVQGKTVTLRPHPQTIKFAHDKVMEIVKAHESNPKFTYENNVQGQESLHLSDVMICDWSGAALDYAFGLGKRVLFVDVPRKVNNPSYAEIEVEPFEVGIRNVIGTVIDPDNIDALADIPIDRLPAGMAEKHVYNVGKSDEVGAAEILRMLDELTVKPS